MKEENWKVFKLFIEMVLAIKRKNKIKQHRNQRISGISPSLLKLNFPFWQFFFFNYVLENSTNRFY